MSQLLEKIKYTWREHGGLVLLGRALRFAYRQALGYTPKVDCGVEPHPDAPALQEMRRRAQNADFRPLVSIILPVYETEQKMLSEVLKSVAEQAYENWELCIVDDASKQPHVRSTIEAFREGFPGRVKVHFRETNGHISASSNDALRMATGEYLALLDHDDILAPHALYEVVSAAAKDTDAILFYSNEDKVDQFGTRFDTTYKSAWSPDQFLSFMYMGHLSVYRTEIVRQVGGFRVGFEGSQDFDLALRAITDEASVVHIPKVLYHWRTHPGSVAMNIHAKPYAFKSGVKAVTEAATRFGFNDIKISMPRPGIYDLRVSRNESFRVVKSLSELTELPSAQWVYVSSGVSTHLADELLSRCISPKVGAIGPAVSDADGRIVTAGLVTTETGVAFRLQGAAQEDDGYGARLVTPSNVSALGPWGLLLRVESIKKFDFAALNGLTEFESAILLSAWLRRGKWRLVCHGGVRGVLSEDLSNRISSALSPKAKELISSVDPLFFGHDPFYPVGLSINPPNFQRAA